MKMVLEWTKTCSMHVKELNDYIEFYSVLDWKCKHSH